MISRFRYTCCGCVTAGRDAAPRSPERAPGPDKCRLLGPCGGCCGSGGAEVSGELVAEFLVPQDAGGFAGGGAPHRGLCAPPDA